ncbi:hypothetical protein D9Q98_005479 [Chlorella vulgaris]|uniref:GH18 domain-containing protein n=1 Tax=Chlorella vulgaris TaxID=3077 RepID=A0A9D4YW52_CHLVU|nr:hypothetical protein D9Q98_005479 [Chlorella vulgaris]
MFGLLALSLCFMLTMAVPLAREDSVESARATLAAAANGMGSGGMGGVIAAAEVACTSDSATVFCATKPATIDRFYANIASGCSCFYRCTPGRSYAYTCQSPTLFNEAQQQSYYESWADPWAGDAASSAIASLPSYANIICLSFMLPDSTYHGGITFAGTGLSFSSEPAVIRAAIALLKQRRPNTKVLISVGGATYPNWSKLNATAVASFVKAFGLDGVDIDFEGEAGCTRGIGGKVSCQSDVPYTQAILKLRAVLPRPYLIATAAWSIGAYGEGAWANSMPQGANTGMLINVLKNAGSQLDYVFVMSYDAGDANTTGYNPVEAIQAYCSYHPCNRVLGGIQIPPEAWGGAETTVAEAEAFGLKMKQMGAGGVMMWAAFKTGPPSAQQLAQAACRSLALGGCTSSLVE